MVIGKLCLSLRVAAQTFDFELLISNFGSFLYPLQFTTANYTAETSTSEKTDRMSTTEINLVVFSSFFLLLFLNCIRKKFVKGAKPHKVCVRCKSKDK